MPNRSGKNITLSEEIIYLMSIDWRVLMGGDKWYNSVKFETVNNTCFTGSVPDFQFTVWRLSRCYTSK